MYNNMIINHLFDSAVETEYVSNAKIAAAVVRRGNIVSEATNSKKTHPFQKKYGKNSDAICLHAEIHAIIKALRVVEDDDLSRHDLYVVRVKKESSKGKFVFGNAKPCVGCSRAISAFGIRNVFFSTDDGKIDYL